MATINKLSVILIGAFAVCSAPLYAGLNASSEPRDTVVETNNAAFENASTQLRCWQYGKLLFEEINFEKESLNAADKLIKFKQKDKGQQLYLVELGTATCMFKEK